MHKIPQAILHDHFNPICHLTALNISRTNPNLEHLFCIHIYTLLRIKCQIKGQKYMDNPSDQWVQLTQPYSLQQMHEIKEPCNRHKQTSAVEWVVL